FLLSLICCHPFEDNSLNYPVVTVSNRGSTINRIETLRQIILSQTSHYSVRCDPQDETLIIAESTSLAESKPLVSRNGIIQHKINPNKLVKFGGTDNNPLRLPSGNVSYQCKLGDSLYEIRIDPNIQNGRVMGECGGGEPDIALSLSRNKKQIIDSLGFQYCRENQQIISIQILENSNEIRTLSILPVGVNVERHFSLSSQPTDWQKAIFEGLQEGSNDANLFILVNQRNIVAIKEAVQKGANPNALDNNGFPAIAHIGNGREKAYRLNKVVEFDQSSTEIAKILITAGGAGNFVNKSGTTLLDFAIISNMPRETIFLLIANGADPKLGTPLVAAARRADVILMQELIDKGAQVNQTARDGITPIWMAATSGFYQYSSSGMDTPPIAEYAKCVRLLLKNRAHLVFDDDRTDISVLRLISLFGNEEKLKYVLKDLIANLSRNEVVGILVHRDRSFWHRDRPFRLNVTDRSGLS
ncbi:hypothetical protein AAKU58_004441, partial [Oxalobacteraceae bacterium GrIS 1.18]